jgi:hypothetical protein
MQGVVDNVNLSDGTRNNYVILMTDGLPNCMGNPEMGVTPLIAQLYMQSPSVRTFVIGFGNETAPNPVASQATNPVLLNDWATAGHTALTGPTQYYQASNAMALEAAIEDIVVGVAQCTFNVTTPPADPSLVVGYINGSPIAADPTNGFSYDIATQSVTFHGMSCQTIQNDTMVEVKIVYGCPPPVSGP